MRLGERVTVVAPHAEGVAAGWEDEGVEVTTFRYAPERWEVLGGEDPVVGVADEQLAEVVTGGGEARHRPVDDDERVGRLSRHEEIVRAGVAMAVHLWKAGGDIDEAGQTSCQLVQVGA